MLIYLLFLPLAVAVGWGLRRDIRRAVARAQWRRANHSLARALVRVRADVGAFGVSMREAMLAAQKFEAASRRFAAELASAAARVGGNRE